MDSHDIFTFAVIIIVFVLMIIFYPKLFKIAIQTKRAKTAAPVKATVLRMAPAPAIAGSTEVLFELADGRRVVLNIINPPFVVGETGLLTYYGQIYNNFQKTDN